MFPEVHRLPHAQQESSLIHTQGHRLRRQRSADVSRHVIWTLVIVPIAVTPTVPICRTPTILRNNRFHPGRQVLKHPGVSVFIDGQARAGVQTGEVQHTLIETGASNPGIELLIQSGETRSRRSQLQDMQTLHQIHG